MGRVGVRKRNKYCLVRKICDGFYSDGVNPDQACHLCRFDKENGDKLLQIMSVIVSFVTMREPLIQFIT